MDWKDAIHKFEQAAAYKKAVMEGRNPKTFQNEFSDIFDAFFNHYSCTGDNHETPFNRH